MMSNRSISLSLSFILLLFVIVLFIVVLIDGYMIQPTSIIRSSSSLLSLCQLNKRIIQHKSILSNIKNSKSMSNRLLISSLKSAMSSSTTTTIPSWNDLQKNVGLTTVGNALDVEVIKRTNGIGSPHVQNKLRLFGKADEIPPITLYRDHAGWCPYCQKTMLLIEEKQIPIKIELVPMRSYGDKPREFMQKVPSGLLPAIEVKGRVTTDSQVIMGLLDQWHQEEDGYRPMLPSKDNEVALKRYTMLANLERELFSWWCTLVFRPEGPRLGGSNNPIKMLLNVGRASDSEMSSSMKGFLECIQKVNDQLVQTKGPWFFDEYNYPTMIDFIYVSHIERMLASCAYWKGLNLRDPKLNLIGLNNWLQAFEQRESYLAFKSDYYTHIKDIPPQYGRGCDGGFEIDRQTMSQSILGNDGTWSLPLPHDDPLQPLYYGPPLPLCVLESMNIQPDTDGTYMKCNPSIMALACRNMAGWKLASNGINISNFASRGGPLGSKNTRKTFGAELADPYANADDIIKPFVDAALRVVCMTLIDTHADNKEPSKIYEEQMKLAVPIQYADGVIPCLRYLRDRIGVPRDLPLASARYLRAHLNWSIGILSNHAKG